jgi:hypothetical protein
MTSQIILLMILDVGVVIGTVAGAVFAARTIANSTKAGVAALSITVLGVMFVMLNSFHIIDGIVREGSDVIRTTSAGYIHLAAAQDAPFCECHFTHSGDKVTTTCNPPGCGH